MSKLTGLLAVVLLAGSVPATAQAATVSAVTFDSAIWSSTSTNSTRGYSFNVTQSGLYVTALSVWDYLGDGLSAGHDVGLWDSAGNLLASTTIASGTSATLLDGFRYVDIDDVLLSVGTNYVVGATFLAVDTDGQAVDLVNLSTATGITYVQSRYILDTAAGVLTRPTSTLALDRTGLIGGSFLLEGPAPVPLPAAAWLLLSGLGGLGLLRRRKAA